ncbi:MAG TPA: hypothetical protein VG986_23545 [Pseudolabrys sp.]|nr:hypothetical protein [Pseudolabrys sp.]
MAAYTPSVASPRHLAYVEPAKAAGKARPGLVSRILAAMQASRLRQAEREIARYLASNGDKFTDESEREIERRFLSKPF